MRKITLKFQILTTLFGLLLSMSIYAQNPGGVSGASLWLKADGGRSNSGSNVTDWNDQTGINNFSVIGSPQVEFNAINFKPVISFVNANPDPSATLPTTRLNGNTPISYVDGFAVYKNSANQTTVIGSTQPGTNFGVGIFAGGNSTAVFVSNGTASTNQRFDNQNVSQFGIVNLDVSLASAPFATGRLNSQPQTMTDGGGGNFNTINFTPMIGGSNNNGAVNGWHAFNGQLAEVVLFPTSLSITDKIKVESYLAIKYGISLGNNTTSVAYTSSAGTTIWTADATYKNDIFGIGKDDGSGLNQTSSNSLNTGSGDGTGQSGKGNIVLSNASSLENNDFLIIGHDNGALTEQTTDLPSSLAGGKRLGREWKVKHTNDVGTITLKFSTLGLTLSGASLADFKLLFDTDGNGNFADGTVTEVVPTSISGNELVFNTVALPQDAVFTFMTQKAPVGPGVLGANLWLKADAGITQSSGKVSSWANQGSMSNADATQSLASKQPTLITSGANQINFQPILSFDGTDDTMATPILSGLLGGTPGNETATQFVVYRHVGSNYDNLYNASDLSGPWKIGFNNVGQMLQQNLKSDPTSLVQSGEVALADMTATTLSAGSSTLNLNINGTSGQTVGGDYRDIPNSPLNFGTYAGNLFQVNISELVVYPSILSDSDRNKVQSYLALKYGISLGDNTAAVAYTNSAGTTIWAADATYKNDIFGIGKDDGNGLNQTSSNSMNTGSGDGSGQSGKGNIVLSAPSSLDTNDFLIIGHDNGALTEQTTDLPIDENGNNRFAREWKVKHTGDVGTVNLQFDLTGLCLSGIQASDYTLVIDADGNGNFTDGTITKITASTLVSNKVTFNNVSLPNNAVFTFMGTPSKLALTSNTSTTSQTVCNNNAITPITYSVTNATGVNATDLPNGVAAVYNNGVITLSGTPTVAGTFNYTLTVISSQCTPAPTATGTISVTATNTVSNASTAPTLCQNSIVSPITHTTTGATGIGTAIGLPTGVQALWSANTITISGTPTVSGIFNYTIPLTGGCGTVNATGTITVTTKPSQPIITAAGPTAFCT
ncbi:beta strand repeat-containing protein, partial [Flavobacterium sp. RSSA_27]|uniref:beta strand repeat-containing protein n=1 Tax=Flavobacterium sp. RSSA_27 TaxID=3447667 RepID=UPI003F2E6A20